MDKVLADTLRANLKNADTAKSKIDAIILAQISIVDCQLKTSDRVKSLVEEREKGKIILGVLGTILSVVGPFLAILLEQWLTRK